LCLPVPAHEAINNKRKVVKEEVSKVSVLGCSHLALPLAPSESVEKTAEAAMGYSLEMRCQKEKDTSWAGGVVKMVEHLPRKHEALSSNP
jgi:hypothetical protein